MLGSVSAAQRLDFSGALRIGSGIAKEFNFIEWHERLPNQVLSYLVLRVV